MKSIIPIALLALSVNVNSQEQTHTEGDIIKVPVGQQAAEKQSMQRPTLGMTKEQVEKHFGEPQSWTDPKGEPPISRWEYQDFMVYFEGDYVIHSVIKTTPKTNN